MRIAIIGTRGYPSTYGGFETLVRHLAPALKARGHEVIVYSRERTGTAVVNGVVVIGTRGLDGKSTSTATHGFSAAVSATSMTRPDVVFVCNVANGPVLPLLQSRGIPTLVNVDGIEWERQKWGKLAKAAFRLGARLTAKYATELVSDSRAIRARWIQEFGRESHYIPYGGTPITDNPGALSDLGITPQKYLLAVARLVPENNVGHILDLAETEPAAPVVVVGSSGHPNGLEARAQDLSRRGAIQWLGHVGDQHLLAQLWANSGVYIHGHSVGGTNPALVQAMTAGAPVLAFDTIYNREVLGDCGLYWDSTATLAARASALLRNRAWATSLGRAAKERARSEYSWDQVTEAYAQALEELGRHARRFDLGRTAAG